MTSVENVGLLSEAEIRKVALASAIGTWPCNAVSG